MMDRDMHYEQGDDENLPNPLQQGLTSRNSENQVSESNSETVIVIGSEETEVASGEDGKLKTKIDILETSMGPGEEPKVNALEPGEACVHH
ncbi:hypothetical protein L1049_023912 [Liquidambar formosana]|uniref:Uncharacterized protein n=1 Tax=Liquidambar formosana TaxID=63359 RepID=A0AAP0S112_LIQFO